MSISDNYLLDISNNKKSALVKRVYDINLNYLGVNPPQTPPLEGKSGVRSKPTPRPLQEGKNEVERGIEGESFLVA